MLRRIGDLRQYRGLALFALLAGSSALYIACSGTDHTFADDDATSPSDDTNADETKTNDTNVDTSDDADDDVPSSNH
jgi:hypothetical protein